MGKIKALIIITVISVIFVNSGPSTSFRINAQEMSSQNFRLEGGNFNMTSGNKASKNFKISDVVGQVASTVFASKGYIIQSGFLNSYAGSPFAFSIAPTLVDFGSLVPNSPVEKEVRISISNGNATGYTVKVSENQPMATSVGAEIADTVCDSNNNTPCTKSNASLWTQSSAYGFGYKISGKTIVKDMLKDNYYRPFAATRRNEQPILIMETHAKKVVDQATMTLKVAVGPNQPVGQYRNVISFTAMVGI